MENPAPAPAAAAVPAAPHSPPGYTGIWIGISAELFEFTVFFAAYFITRWHFPEVFRAGAPQLWTAGGLLITLVMLTSGYALVRVVHAVRGGSLHAARRWMALASIIALGYPLLKYLEIRYNLAHGINPRGHAFFTVYYYLTINHFMHSTWGIFGMFWLNIRLWQQRECHENLRVAESMAIYWHATDLVWLMLFSMFYAFV